MLKKVLIILLCTLTLFAIVSCDRSAKQNTEENGSETLLEESQSAGEEQTEAGISAEEALEIAKSYWSHRNSDGYIIAEVSTDRAPDSVYVFVLKHRVYNGENYYYSTIDEVWIDRASGEAMPPYDINKGVFFDYDTILSIYKIAASNYTQGFTGIEDSLAEIKGKFKNENEKQLFIDIATAGYLKHPGRYTDQYSFYTNAIGYAKKDLNGDGAEELVLLNGDYSVVALFSMTNGEPVLLDCCLSERKDCFIDGKGLIHIGGSSGADVGSKEIYKISADGAYLEPLFEYGLAGHQWIDGVAMTMYYKIENGERLSITEEEYKEIDEKYAKYLENKTAKEVTKTLAGLQFISLFSKPFSFSSYEEIIDSVSEMTTLYNYYKLAEFTREETEWLYDLSTEENREMYELLDLLVLTYYPPALGASSPFENAFAYAIDDINGDGTDELLFIEGDRYDVFAVFTQRDGKIILDNTHSFDRPSGGASHALNYWINTVGLDLKPLFSSSQHFDLNALREKAALILRRALSENPDESIWIPDEERFVESLWDYVVPSSQKPLGDIEDLKFAFVDPDGDTLDELVIATGEEVIVLRSSYAVYLYCIPAAEFQKYLDDNGIADVRFSSLGELLGDKLSPDEALEIAREHWKNRLDADEDLDIEMALEPVYFTQVVPENVYIFLLYSKSASRVPYRDEVWVDVFTGEIYQFAK